MNHVWKKTVLAATGIALMAGQTSAPSFEVASIKLNKNARGAARLRYNPAGIDFGNVPLSWIIGEAYQVPFARISSSDSRIQDSFFTPKGSLNFYDVEAKADHAVSKEQVRLMLQTLLAERFKLVLHRESRVQPVYKLVVGKGGPKLQESIGEGEPTGGMGPGGLTLHNAEIARFCGILSGFLDRPVVDETGLKASYDFTLKLEVPDKSVVADWFASSIFAEIQKQLGLQLQADKAAIDYLVIDHVEQPSEN